MPHLLLWFIFLACFSFFNTCDTKHLQGNNEVSLILSQLLENINKPPILVYIDPKQNDNPEDHTPGSSIEENLEDLSQKYRSVEESLEDLEQLLRSIGQPSEDIKERIRSIEESSIDLGQLLRYIGQPSEDIKQRIRSIEENSEDLEQLLRSIGQPSEGIKQSLISIDEGSEDFGQLFRSISKGPSLSRDEDENEKQSEEYFIRTSKDDERAYLLHHLLRTTIERENIDPEMLRKLQPVKDFLRGAFNGRCRKLNECRTCTATSKISKPTCPKNCKQIYDDLDECDEPKKKKQPKDCSNSCGHTMPPSWLL